VPECGGRVCCVRGRENATDRLPIGAILSLPCNPSARQAGSASLVAVNFLDTRGSRDSHVTRHETDRHMRCNSVQACGIRVHSYMPGTQDVTSFIT
jgi:hypothetical protein